MMAKSTDGPERGKFDFGTHVQAARANLMNTLSIEQAATAKINKFFKETSGTDEEFFQDGMNSHRLYLYMWLEGDLMQRRRLLELEEQFSADPELWYRFVLGELQRHNDFLKEISYRVAVIGNLYKHISRRAAAEKLHVHAHTYARNIEKYGYPGLKEVGQLIWELIRERASKLGK
jgi:hypothetical protein